MSEGLLVLALALALWGLWTAHRGAQADEALAAAAAEALKQRGFHEARLRKPRVEEPLPPGATPIARASGRVDFGPRRGTLVPTEEPAAGSSPQHLVSTGRSLPADPCPLTPDDLRGGCDTTVVLAGRTPLVQQRWWAEARLPDDTIVRREATLDPVQIEVTPTVVPPRWRLDILAGLSTDAGVELGATWTGRSRLGAYAIYEYTSGDARIHGGLRWRMK